MGATVFVVYCCRLKALLVFFAGLDNFALPQCWFEKLQEVRDPQHCCSSQLWFSSVLSVITVPSSCLFPDPHLVFAWCIFNPCKFLQTFPQWHIVFAVAPVKVRCTSRVVITVSCSLGLSSSLPLWRPSGCCSFICVVAWYGVLS